MEIYVPFNTTLLFSGISIMLHRKLSVCPPMLSQAYLLLSNEDSKLLKPIPEAGM